MNEVHKISNDHYVALSGNNLCYYEITGASRSATQDIIQEKFTDWAETPIDLEGFKVIPFGSNNDIPEQIQEAVLANSFALRGQKRKVELLVEQGPYIYKHVKDGRLWLREPFEEPKIQEWLDSINYEEMLHQNAIDYYFQESIFTKVLRKKEGRIRTSTPASIEYVPAYRCRLAYKANDIRKIPTHVIIGDWTKLNEYKFEVYPLYNAKEPGKYPVSIYYNRYSNYGMLDYPMPDIYGSLQWIKNTTNTPKIFNAFIKNSLNIKWHIESPAEYWEAKRKILQDNAKAAGKNYTEKMLEDLKTEILGKLAELLSGVENVGKFWHNETVQKFLGGATVTLGWKITPIEQKTKEWVESQIKMYDTAKFAVQAALGVHASLLMVGADGKSDSGSEQLNAYIVHQKTSTPMPEFYVTRPINEMIKILFGNQFKVGFYRTTPERQQDITPSLRAIPPTPSNPL
ncbi:hypothetical protein EZY14_002695 [Kordia sp. TARA_039_SRF]|nr:hypothetical protein EZY14_002695 [Kordia sp. TARA_039_SRF]